MKRRDFCKALVCGAALAPGLALPRAEAAAKSQTVGRAVPAGNYTLSFRSELSQTDVEHEYYYSDAFFAHTSTQYDHQLALATLGMVGAAFNTWASDAKYWVNGDVGRENSLLLALILLAGAALFLRTVPALRGLPAHNNLRLEFLTRDARSSPLVLIAEAAAAVLIRAIAALGLPVAGALPGLPVRSCARIL